MRMLVAGGWAGETVADDSRIIHMIIAICRSPVTKIPILSCMKPRLRAADALDALALAPRPAPHLLPRADALVTRAVRPLGPTSLPSTLSSLAAPSGVSRSWRVSLLWLLCPQVKAGSIFDNILVCDDPDFAKAEAEKNIVPLQEKEKEMKKKVDDEEAETRRKEEVCVPWLPRR